MLYVEELRLCERMAMHRDAFVIWDVGLGAGGNALTVLHEARGLEPRGIGPAAEQPAAPRGTGDSTLPMLRIVSFDRTMEPLIFAVSHARELGYFEGYEHQVATLLARQTVEFADGGRTVRWTAHLGDFPTLIQPSDRDAAAAPLPSPDAILFDPSSPVRNPEMWTAVLFANLFRRLDPLRPCALATYSRSTMVRVSLLLAGLFVGIGGRIAEKDETTVAANDPVLLRQPLDARWLERAFKSGGAEPLWEPTYRQAPLSETTKARLREHPQFRGR
jgi:hypothetical protein